MDLNRIIRFRIGSEDWEMPLGILLLLVGITLIMMIGGIYLGFSYGRSQY